MLRSVAGADARSVVNSATGGSLGQGDFLPFIDIASWDLYVDPKGSKPVPSFFIGSLRVVESPIRKQSLGIQSPPENGSETQILC